MKRIIIITAIAVFTFAAFAQEEKKEKKCGEKKTELKAHVCTDDCKEGKHVYAHGEKGHTCTDACKKKM